MRSASGQTASVRCSRPPARTGGSNCARPTALTGSDKSGFTKVHLAADGRGLPLAVVVTPGHANDSTVFDTAAPSLGAPSRACSSRGPHAATGVSHHEQASVASTSRARLRADCAASRRDRSV
ncbi:transposase [Streptomyces olivaceiscleroticus]|uniref:transposase n=1 Tax=Streptomyces olivaceiscleroticus TaxID=68245 RepID=UPI003D156B29